MQMSFRHSVGPNLENGLYFPSAVLSLDYDASESWRASCCVVLWVVCSQTIISEDSVIKYQTILNQNTYDILFADASCLYSVF